MYDEQHFTRDAAIVSFDGDVDGVTVDENGDASFEWDEVERVVVDNPPHAEAFDTKEFYRIPATVAKPIPQAYQYGEDTVWLKKPREELKKAAWSLDNAPWTLGHPETGMVKSVDDIHGFWQNPRYIDSLDDLDADLHIPTKDEEAKEYVEDNTDVSVGFYNKIARIDEYDGIVGGEDDEAIEIEGYQTNMLFDHCASVAVGRCSSEKGCGIDDMEHGHVSVVDSEAFKSGTRITHKSDEVEEPKDFSDMEETTDAPEGIFVYEGDWYAIGPDEHGEDSTQYDGDGKYPVNNCEDVKDAWNLRGSGDYSISGEALEERIKRVADAKDCPDSDMPWTDSFSGKTGTDAVIDSAQSYSICGCGTVAEGDCDEQDNEEDTTMEINIDDLSVDAALAKMESQHEGVSERLDELREAEDAAEAAQDTAEELGLDSVDDLQDKVALLQDRKDELEEQVDELQRPQMEEDAEFIADRTDRFGEDADEVIENLDADPETVADKRELVEDLAEGYDEQTANSGGSSNETETRDTVDGKYAVTPWE